MGYKPVNKYLPPRRRRADEKMQPAQSEPVKGDGKTVMDDFFRWADRLLSR
jgi:hypothetical protein